MAQRKANLPVHPAKETESPQRVEAPKPAVSGRIPLGISAAQLADCVKRQEHALRLIIADRNSPPIDGGIFMIGAALDLLARIDPTEV